MSDLFLFVNLAPPDRDYLAKVLGWTEGNLSPVTDAYLGLNVLKSQGGCEHGQA